LVIHAGLLSTGGGLLVAVRKVFSWNFQFLENGNVVGEMEASLWRETAELELDDGTYGFYRDQVIGGDYLLEHKGKSSPEPRNRVGGGPISTPSSSNEASSCEDRRSSNAASGCLREAGKSESYTPGCSPVAQRSTFRRTGLCSTAFFFFGFAR